jgi:hypothetical protein
VIYDFPEFAALQRFYLRAHGLPTAAGPRLERDRPGIVALSTLAELDEALEGRSTGPAALVGLWSLAEAPRALRDEVMLRVTGFDAFVFGYHPRFGEMDNTAWFAALRGRLGETIAWHDVPLLPQQEALRHLFGFRRGP